MGNNFDNFFDIILSSSISSPGPNAGCKPTPIPIPSSGGKPENGERFQPTSAANKAPEKPPQKAWYEPHNQKEQGWKGLCEALNLYSELFDSLIFIYTFAMNCHCADWFQSGQKGANISKGVYFALLILTILNLANSSPVQERATVDARLICYGIGFFRYYIHIGVGFCVASPDRNGNARA